MQRHPLIIMAAGQSSRMKKALETGSEIIDPKLIHEANTLPKSMLSVGPGGTRFIDFILSNAMSAGFNEIVMVLHMDDSTTEYHVRSTLSKLSAKVSLTIARQITPEGRTKPWGTGDAVYQGVLASNLAPSDHYSIVNSDNLCSIEALRMAREFKGNAVFSYATAALGISSADRSKYGLILIDTVNHRMVSMVEKPTAEEILELEKIGELSVNMNLYTYNCGETQELLSELVPHPVRNEKELNDVANILAAHGKMGAYIITESMPDLTSKADIPRVQEYLNTHYSHIITQLTHG
jgi:glucose-1-phosphate adenylyltransferase